MTIFQSTDLLSWGSLDLPLFGIHNDWFGTPLSKPATFSLACDTKALWFIACHDIRPEIHPLATPHNFTPELWKHDCAELFLSSEITGQYLEFNLAPNSAWWACKFTSPRIVSSPQPDFPKHVQTWHQSDDHRWIAAMAIDIELLKNEINFPRLSAINVTFILNSPDQKFVSATQLKGQSPDFHQPSSFCTIRTSPLP